jgi:hypothetical protein
MPARFLLDDDDDDNDDNNNINIKTNCVPIISIINLRTR